MTFCTAVNCIDGRTQLPVIAYLERRFGAEYVDLITEPGPSLLLARRRNPRIVNNVVASLDISVNQHGSRVIAVVAHEDCAGVPEPKEVQLKYLKRAVEFVDSSYPEVEVIGLWVDENWQVTEV